MSNVFLLPFSSSLDISKEIIATLTGTRQDILMKLLHGSKTISQIAKEADSNVPTIMKAMDELLTEKLVEKKSEFKTETGKIKIPKIKFYELTKKGKLLAFMIAEPNGWTKAKIEKECSIFLRDELGINENIIRDLEKINIKLKG